MASPDTAARARYLLVAAVVGHVLLISAQVGTSSGPSLLRTAVVTVVTEIQDASWLVVGGVRSVFDSYAALRGVREENARLEQENAELQVQLQQARANAAGGDDMRALLDLRAHVPWKTTGADVIAGSVSPDFRSISIDKGAREGVARDMPVIERAGVVGRVALPAAHASTVQLVIDRSAASAARIERSRTEGIALGNGDGTLRLEYLSATADVVQGDQVVTAGIDGVYPPGLVLGMVERVQRAGPAYRQVIIRPAVDFSRLETVLVLVGPAPAAAEAEPAADPKGAK